MHHVIGIIVCKSIFARRSFFAVRVCAIKLTYLPDQGPVNVNCLSELSIFFTEDCCYCRPHSFNDNGAVVRHPGECMGGLMGAILLRMSRSHPALLLDLYCVEAC